MYVHIDTYDFVTRLLHTYVVTHDTGNAYDKLICTHLIISQVKHT